MLHCPDADYDEAKEHEEDEEVKAEDEDVTTEDDVKKTQAADSGDEVDDACNHDRNDAEDEEAAPVGDQADIANPYIDTNENRDIHRQLDEQVTATKPPARRMANRVSFWQATSSATLL